MNQYWIGKPPLPYWTGEAPDVSLIERRSQFCLLFAKPKGVDTHVPLPGMSIADQPAPTMTQPNLKVKIHRRVKGPEAQPPLVTAVEVPMDSPMGNIDIMVPKHQELVPTMEEDTDIESVCSEVSIWESESLVSK